MTMKKEGCDTLKQNMSCTVRQLPFGLIEVVFPRESANLVLTTLGFHQKTPYNLNASVLGLSPLSMLKKFLHIDDIPQFDSSKKLVFPSYDVAVIPIGIRHDGELTETSGEYVGYSHESL
jgi:hypothetical protein